MTNVAAGKLKKLRVKEVGDFQLLKEEWNGLLEKSLLGNNVFLTWEWLSTWWKHFGQGRKLLLLTVEEQDRILAIAPLMLTKYRLPGLGNIQKIEFVGTPHSDYHNFILEKEEECLRLLIKYIKENLSGWNWIELKEIPESSVTKLVRSLPENNLYELRLNVRVCDVCPYVPLPASFELLMKGLKKNTRQNLNKYMRRIKENGNIELKRYDTTGLSVRENMEIFIALHQKGWTARGFSGAFETRQSLFHDFHIDIAEKFAEKDWLGLYFLTASDEPVASQYTFEYGDKMYYYLAGLDPRYASYSVGNLIIKSLLETCISKGLKEYDMLRGDEPYKYQWTKNYRRNFEIRLISADLPSRFYNWITLNKTINSLVEKLKLSLKQNSIS
jgi:CelD/BcsL family acetyltransferase involved in cellulose biosynthesis